MSRKPLFAGLVIDENDNPVSITYVGGEPCYVVNDMGFLRHIPSEQVDRQVLQSMQDMIEGKESLISEQAAKMLGQEDIFTKAMIENQLKHVDKQFDALLDSGIPEEGRAYMGMMGFRIRINLHGEVLEINQPGISDPDQE
jgi:organic radical activating enzyme